MNEEIRNDITYLECKLETARENEHIALCRIAELELEVKRLESVVDMLTGDLAS